MTADPPAAPATDPDGFPVEETPPPPHVILARLRAKYPRWAFLHDPQTGVWTALRGDETSGLTIHRPDGLALATALRELPGWQQ